MKKSKTIIFDLGNVIMDIEFSRTFEQFKNLVGETKYDEVFAAWYESEFYKQMETGEYGAEEMTNALNSFGVSLLQEEVTAAWNALLAPIQPERFERIKELKEDYNILLLSNTNKVHIEAIWEMMNKDFGYNPFFEHFDHLFLSYQMATRKPEPSIYQQLIKQSGIDPHQAVFLDDLQKNLNAAAEFGIKGELVTRERNMMKILTDY